MQVKSAQASTVSGRHSFFTFAEVRTSVSACAFVATAGKTGCRKVSIWPTKTRTLHKSREEHGTRGRRNEAGFKGWVPHPCGFQGCGFSCPFIPPWPGNRAPSETRKLDICAPPS